VALAFINLLTMRDAIAASVSFDLHGPLLIVIVRLEWPLCFRERNISVGLAKPSNRPRIFASGSMLLINRQSRTIQKSWRGISEE
jgi:hypothetical protein